MPACPVCETVIDGDDALARHVNAHFGDESQGGGNNDTNDVQYIGEGPPAAIESCFVCGTDLSGLTGTEANAHVNSCLDGGDGAAPEPEFGPEDDSDFYLSDQENDYGRTQRKNGQHDGQWDGAAFAGHSKVEQVAKGDRWWDPTRGSLTAGGVPPNISPGLIPVLYEILRRGAASGTTRSAVLAKDGVHIRGTFGFDGSWGCGYRNALMAIATMWDTYPSALQDRGDPGVRAIQAWIEEAWRAGFDLAGKEQLKGKLVGTKKWIGTTDLYGMFAAMGIPCVLYDFNKPSERDTDEPTHKILERWVREYFDEDADDSGDSSNAFNELMRPRVRIGTKLPFILQHAGHSRTVVGYELAGKDVNLIIFDPGKSVPKDLRQSGIDAAKRMRENTNETGSTPPTVKFSPQEDNAAATPLSDEEVGLGGWVRKKKAKIVDNPLVSSLSSFRVNLGRWKHNQYQAERNARRVVDSVDVQR